LIHPAAALDFNRARVLLLFQVLAVAEGW